MNWKLKALVAATCDSVPMGPQFYQFLQKHFGRLDASSHTRLTNQQEMAQWLSPYGGLAGKTLFEVGTGHIPWIPIGFYLSGAAKVFTYDLYPRMDIQLVKEALAWIATNREKVASMYPDAADRLEVLTRLRSDPQGLFQAANIVYKSPADAASSGLPDQSIDVHFSFATFEHIPQESIAAINNVTLSLSDFERSFPASGRFHNENQLSPLLRQDVADHWRQPVRLLQPSSCKQLCAAVP